MLQPDSITPVVVRLVEPGIRETPVVDAVLGVLTGALGVVGVILVGAVVAGLLLGGIFIGARRLRPSKGLEAHATEGLRVGLHSPS